MRPIGSEGRWACIERAKSDIYDCLVSHVCCIKTRLLYTRDDDGVTLGHWQSSLRQRCLDHIPVTLYGRSISTNSRSKNVGTGFCEQDLVGNAMMLRRTSSSVHGVSTVNAANTNSVNSSSWKSILSSLTGITENISK